MIKLFTYNHTYYMQSIKVGVAKVDFSILASTWLLKTTVESCSPTGAEGTEMQPSLLLPNHIPWHGVDCVHSGKVASFS